MADSSTVPGTLRTALPAGPVAAVAGAVQPVDGALPAGDLGAAAVRIVTANVQSFPDDALTQDQALEDLSANALAGDLVLLQEIAPRYRPLVDRAFPPSEWAVFYGRGDNTEPIAFRRRSFAKVAGHVQLLHPAVAGLHNRRYVTHLRLTSRASGRDFHVTNLHLVAGAFNGVDEPDQALRLQEWNEGIAKHRAFVERLVRSGLPVVGGGDYNRQLRSRKSLGDTIAGRTVTYAVGQASIDLLWFIDGTDSAWSVLSTRAFAGRTGRNPRRHSDHAARLARATLAPATPSSPPTSSSPPAASAPERPPRVTTKAPPRPRAVEPAPPPRLPEPFEITAFGDQTPRKVDWKTRAALEEVQRLLGYPLTLVQGSYNAGGVSQSAGTHDGGGVVDLLAWDWQRKVRVLRSVGFAAWHRSTVPGLWNEHIHAVLIDHGRLSPSAARQVVAYRAGRDGLRSNRPDPFWRPDPVPVFSYPPPASAAVAPPAVAPAGSADSFPPRRTLDGVDTSHHQSGRIDLKAARAAGVRWWYLKATEGSTVTDTSYRQRVRQARAAGIPVGAYHFARPDPGDAAGEARFFLQNSEVRAGDMLPMLDLESLEGMSLTAVTRWTGEWVATVTRELGRRGLAARPIIYTPFDLGNGFGCLLWVARYSDDFRPPRIPRPWTRAAVWQHSDGRYGPVKRVPGFGAVDVNAVHPDVPLSALRVTAIRRAPATPTPLAPPTTESSPSTAPEGGLPDIAAVRRSLQEAVRSLEAALDSLRER